MQSFSSSSLNYSTILQNLPTFHPGHHFSIIGNILEIATNPHKAATKLSRIYGPLMTLKIGSITTIVISSPQLAKQVLHENGPVFSSRTIPHSVHALDHHKYSIVFMHPSPKWRKLEEFVQQKYSPHKHLTPLKSFANKRFINYWIL